MSPTDYAAKADPAISYLSPPVPFIFPKQPEFYVIYAPVLPILIDLVTGAGTQANALLALRREVTKENQTLMDSYAGEVKNYLLARDSAAVKPVPGLLETYILIVMPTDLNAPGYDPNWAGWVFGSPAVANGLPVGPLCPDIPEAAQGVPVFGMFRGLSTLGTEIYTAFNGSTVAPWDTFEVSGLPVQVAPGTNPPGWQPRMGPWQCIPLWMAPAGGFVYLGSNPPFPKPA